jgi:DNA-binding IclR family transcriptional regulator
MLTLAKGLAVLSSFGRHRPTMTLAQAAQAVDLSRATARRVLHTLVGLGYVEQNGRQFALSPRIMRLGFAYISSQSWVDRAVPLMKALSERFHESCSAAILEGTEIIYVARIPARRIMSATLAVGSRLPAFHSSMGRIQLGFLDDAEIWRRLRSVRLEPLTRSWNAACARSQCRSSSVAANASERSISRRIRRAPPATRCAKPFCPSSRPSPSRCLLIWFETRRVLPCRHFYAGPAPPHWLSS